MFSTPFVQKETFNFVGRKNFVSNFPNQNLKVNFRIL